MILLSENHQPRCRMSDGERLPEVSVQTRASNRPGAAVVLKAMVVSNSGKRRSTRASGRPTPARQPSTLPKNSMCRPTGSPFAGRLIRLGKQAEDAPRRCAAPVFVPVPERIAAFDNDSTLWPEHPAPVQFAFVMDELKRRVPTEREPAADPMVQPALACDLAKHPAGAHFDGLMRIAVLTHAGMTTDEFRATVEAWLALAKHPRWVDRTAKSSTSRWAVVVLEN
jgi:hypothetical protein